MKFLDWLTLIFIAFKLAGIITWSWWWVLSPLWISLLVFVVVQLLNRGVKK